MGAYASAVTSDSPTYYWRLNTMGGAYPSSNGNAVGLWWSGTNPHEFREGWSGVDSTGASVYVNGGGLAATDANYLFVLPFSFDWWFFPFNSGNLSPNPQVGLIGNSASTAVAFWQWQASSRQLVFGDRTGVIGAGPAIALNTWHHMGFSIDTGGLTTWYLDGVATRSGSPAATLSFLQAQWNGPQPGSPWLYTELAMYGSLISASRFAAHHTAGTLTYPHFTQNLASCGV
jgi:hypothetical protein